MEKINYDEIVKKATSIVDNLGKEFRADNIDPGLDNLGGEYRYEGLTITKYRGALYIYIANIEVLSYNKNTNQIIYEEGKWPSIINIIYDRLPELTQNRKDLISLTDYVKMFAKYSYNEEIYAFIEKELAKNNITLSREEEGYTVNSPITHEDVDGYFYSWTVSYNGKNVFVFDDVSFDILDNFYVPGEWVSKFKSTLDAALLIERKQQDAKLASTTEEILKRLREL